MPRWMAWRSMIPNQISTRLSQDPEVGVKWMWMRGFRRQPGFDLRVLVGGVVVHDQVQLLVGVAAGEVPARHHHLVRRTRDRHGPGHQDDQCVTPSPTGGRVQPWRVETFKFSTDPELVAKVTDVVGLYPKCGRKAVKAGL